LAPKEEAGERCFVLLLLICALDVVCVGAGGGVADDDDAFGMPMTAGDLTRVVAAWMSWVLHREAERRNCGRWTAL